ncbi:hypothetical protein BZA70DRAFT_282944 [Myxozyma melibiosi]|uniref:Uncharacterized protein n=1 Tax=Myxozyma melibiosi TaxID=54550 RepID=A0ABR1F197_9ASCO
MMLQAGFQMAPSTREFARQHHAASFSTFSASSTAPASPPHSTTTTTSSGGWSASRKSHININYESTYSARRVPSPPASPPVPNPAQIEHLIRLFKDSMRMYLTARRALDRELERQISLMVDVDPNCEDEKRRRQLQTNLRRAEAFVTKYVMILSKLSVDTNSIPLSAPSSRAPSPQRI